MQNTNEFVFRRKRKRLYVRYEDTPAEVQVAQPLNQSSDPPYHPPDLIPEVAVLSGLPSSSPTFPTSTDHSSEPQAVEVSTQHVLTVESFLRRSVQTSSKCPRDVHALGSASRARPRAYTHQRTPQRRVVVPAPENARKPKQVKKSKKQSRIAQALYQAAVLTNADPLDTLMESSGVSPTRRPLNFVTFNKFSDDSPTMGLNKVLESSNLDFGKNAEPHTRRLGNASNVKEHHFHSSHTRRPLDFVPLREAEAAYSIMFPARNAVLGTVVMMSNDSR